mmetsp:Transcript_8154/g.24434  ORF Transcript_8154/g.24434 Transcript_8154/m.24434 type:complete len:221 (-) Transcript_8154:241-903(-)
MSKIDRRETQTASRIPPCLVVRPRDLMSPPSALSSAAKSFFLYATRVTAPPTSISRGITKAALEYKQTAAETVRMQVVTLSWQTFFPSPAAAPATSAMATAVNPATSALTRAEGRPSAPPVAAPRMDIRMNPGCRNMDPLNRPPIVPFFTTPIAKAIWVDVGPLTHWPSARNSVKTCEDSHDLDDTKTRSKVAMWAAGPPKAVHPNTANCFAISTKVTWA